MCAQYGRPAGVAFCFQVCRYSIEPSVPNRACNLFTKDLLRAALADEVKEGGPEVPFVLLGESFACAAERLTGTASCPNRTVSRPSSKLKSEGPSGDPGEEVALGVSFEFMGFDFGDAAGVNVSCGYEFL
jgi:hypothetical protein